MEIDLRTKVAAFLRSMATAYLGKRFNGGYITLLVEGLLISIQFCNKIITGWMTYSSGAIL